MAVALDVVGGALRLSAASSGSNANVSMTVSASATLALFLIDASLQGGNSDSSIGFSVMTLGGSAFTQVASAKKHAGSDGSTSGFLDLYYLLAPPTGTQSASITMTHSGSPASVGQLIARCITFTGTDTSSPLGTAQVVNGNGVSTQTITDTLASGDYFQGIACNGTAAPTVSTGSSDASITGSIQTGSDNALIFHNTGTGSVSLVANVNSGDSSALVGVKIIPPASTAPFPPWPPAQLTVVRM